MLSSCGEAEPTRHHVHIGRTLPDGATDLNAIAWVVSAELQEAVKLSLLDAEGNAQGGIILARGHHSLQFYTDSSGIRLLNPAGVVVAQLSVIPTDTVSMQTDFSNPTEVDFGFGSEADGLLAMIRVYF